MIQLYLLTNCAAKYNSSFLICTRSLIIPGTVWISAKYTGVCPITKTSLVCDSSWYLIYISIGTRKRAVYAIIWVSALVIRGYSVYVRIQLDSEEKWKNVNKKHHQGSLIALLCSVQFFSCTQLTASCWFNRFAKACARASLITRMIFFFFSNFLKNRRGCKMSRLGSMSTYRIICCNALERGTYNYRSLIYYRVDSVSPTCVSVSFFAQIRILAAGCRACVRVFLASRVDTRSAREK